MIEGVRSRLLDAIRVRLRADVKVGVALSGGIDSSVVAGMVNHLIREGEQVGGDAITKKLSCFSIAFDAESGFDESGEIFSSSFFFVRVVTMQLADWVPSNGEPHSGFLGRQAL